MRFVHTVAEVRAAEQRAVAAGISEATLIDRASTAVARRAAQLLGRVYGSRVVILAGKGHNGADALWAGLKLQQRGARVDVVLTGGAPADAQGLTPLRRLRDLGAHVVDDAAAARQMLDPHRSDHPDLTIDGVLGIGARGPLREPASTFLGLCNWRTWQQLAVDIPSGVDADTGAQPGGVYASDVTVTFGCLKPGLVLSPGRSSAGHVEVADIGIAFPRRPGALDGTLGEGEVGILDADDVGVRLHFESELLGEENKYSRGVVGVVAGGDDYVGAAILTCGGALRAGAGMVRLHASAAVAEAVRRAWPEVVAVEPDVAGDRKVDAWVVGPGLGTDERARSLLDEVLDAEKTVVVDADAITLAAKDPTMLRRGCDTVVTPHMGEFTRLTGISRAAAEADRLGVARQVATDLRVDLLLKGSTTVVAGRFGGAYINPTGTSALATAGTGDVLAGAIGALLAGGVPATEAAATAAWLHGLAGRIAAEGGAPIVAADVIRCWPEAVRRVRATRG